MLQGELMEPTWIGLVAGLVSGAFGVGVAYMTLRGSIISLKSWRKKHEDDENERDEHLNGLGQDVALIKNHLTGFMGNNGLIGRMKELENEISKMPDRLSESRHISDNRATTRILEVEMRIEGRLREIDSRVAAVMEDIKKLIEGNHLHRRQQP